MLVDGETPPLSEGKFFNTQASIPGERNRSEGEEERSITNPGPSRREFELKNTREREKKGSDKLQCLCVAFSKFPCQVSTSWCQATHTPHTTQVTRASPPGPAKKIDDEPTPRLQAIIGLSPNLRARSYDIQSIIHMRGPTVLLPVNKHEASLVGSR